MTTKAMIFSCRRPDRQRRVSRATSSEGQAVDMMPEPDRDETDFG
ncbi:hypothetical protein L838_2950 [Mycobacterium avium MAV_120709_2344]|nr:hypothetical protein L838_2950 [Mycobacterium avium MAV_120709_2344]